jgi:ferredoxin
VRVVLDSERCRGHGRCYSLVPALFVDDAAGYGQVRGNGAVAPEQQVDAERAVIACPERAITLEPGE